jgi:hypothetical protein
MINHDYLIDYSDWFDEGGYCQVYPIKDKKDLIFKEFRNKKKAQESYRYHKKLVKYDLAPKIYSKICKLEFAPEQDMYELDPSDWGYVTELAKTFKPRTKITMADIQHLVDDIYDKTGLKFWDCHWFNVGVVKRGKKKKIVCIDTGKESFDGDSNAWGNQTQAQNALIVKSICVIVSIRCII